MFIGAPELGRTSPPIDLAQRGTQPAEFAPAEN
jgi:hypothetical protein